MKHVKNSRTRLRRGACLVLAGLTAFNPLAWGRTMPDVSVFDNAPEVDDSMLASMRGRFVSRGKIVQLGVSMTTEWKTPGGESLTAAANLNVDLSGATPGVKYIPNLSITTLGSTTAARTGSGQMAVSGSGLNNVNGVTQIIQVAGDHNNVLQDTSILISTDPLASSGNSGGLTGPGTASLSSGSSNATVSSTLGPNGISVSVQIPNQGEVLQRLRGNTPGSQGVPGVMQSTRLTGDLQQVRNTMTIQIQTLPSATFGDAGIQPTLQMMRGLRGMGSF